MPVRLGGRASETYDYPLLIGKLLTTPLASAPLQAIVYRDQSRYSYQTLRERIGRLASSLAKLQVAPGSTVAMLDWDSHRYLEAFFAVPMMGAILQTVNVRLSPAQICYTLKHAGAEVAFVHRDFLPLLTEIRGELTALREVIVIEDGGGAIPALQGIAGEYEQLLMSAAPGYAFEDFNENAVATTFYTTGTTGDPKGVCFTHRQIVLHTLALTAALAGPARGQSLRQGDVYMPMTPMFHVHAWGNPYVATLLGVKQVYPGRYLPAELLALRAREGVTFSHCVPTILQMLLKASTETGVSMSGWKICIGGSALSEGLAREALARGIDIFAGYGMSETGPVMTVSRLTANAAEASEALDLERRCRAGLPIPLVDVRIVDAELREQPRDGHSAGEVVVRSPWVTSHYVGNPAASEELWRGGYLHTQDVGVLDASGCLQLTDRTKDVIKSGGEWLSSLELESLISCHADVAEVAVVAMSDERWGERPHALVVPRDGCRTRLTATAIQEHVMQAVAAGRLPKYAVPQKVTFVDALDKTSVGKINKRLLRERYA
jgi:fatty-acyl-CoA synthase